MRRQRNLHLPCPRLKVAVGDNFVVGELSNLTTDVWRGLSVRRFFQIICFWFSNHSISGEVCGNAKMQMFKCFFGGCLFFSDDLHLAHETSGISCFPQTAIRSQLARAWHIFFPTHHHCFPKIKFRMSSAAQILGQTFRLFILQTPLKHWGTALPPPGVQPPLQAAARVLRVPADEGAAEGQGGLGQEGPRPCSTVCDEREKVHWVKLWKAGRIACACLYFCVWFLVNMSVSIFVCVRLNVCMFVSLFALCVCAFTSTVWLKNKIANKSDLDLWKCFFRSYFFALWKTPSARSFIFSWGIDVAQECWKRRRIFYFFRILSFRILFL